MNSPPPRRRAIAVTWFHDHQVGYLDFVYRLQALAREYELTVISRRPLTEPELTLDANVVVYRPARSGSVGLVWYWWRVARHLQTASTDLIVHLCSHTAALASLSLRAPQVVYWNEHPSHYLDSTHWLRSKVAAGLRALQYRGARSARLVLPIGEAHLEDLLAHGCQSSAVLLQAMGVADKFAAVATATPTPPPLTQLRVIYTGSVHPDRGRDVMIDAVALARARGVAVHLTIIGADATQVAACEARAQQQGVAADGFTVLPRVPGEDIPQYLAQAHFGVCLWADKPYWRFNPPTKLFEYLVVGLPVMASNIRTHTAYLHDGEDGYIFEYDAPSLAATFCKAWEERQRWPELRRRALEQGQPYRWSEIEPVFLASLKALLP